MDDTASFEVVIEMADGHDETFLARSVTTEDDGTIIIEHIPPGCDTFDTDELGWDATIRDIYPVA